MSLPIAEVKEAIIEINSENVATQLKLSALMAILYSHSRKVMEEPFSVIAAASFDLGATMERYLAFNAMLRLMKDGKFEQEKLEDAARRLIARGNLESQALTKLMEPVLEIPDPGTRLN